MIFRDYRGVILMKPKNFEYDVSIPAMASVNGGLSVELLSKFFNDGRIVGRYAEFIIESLGIGKRAGNENCSYDNVSPDGLKIEVRSMYDRVSFAPSNEVGKGRKYTDDGWEKKITKC